MNWSISVPLMRLLAIRLNEQTTPVIEVFIIRDNITPFPTLPPAGEGLAFPLPAGEGAREGVSGNTVMYFGKLNMSLVMCLCGGFGFYA